MYISFSSLASLAIWFDLILSLISLKLCVACCVPLCNNSRCGKVCVSPAPGSTGHEPACGAIFCLLCYSQHICSAPCETDEYETFRSIGATSMHPSPSLCERRYPQPEEQDCTGASFDEHLPREVFNLEIFAPRYIHSPILSAPV